METTLHMVRLVKAIWLVRQNTLRRWLVGLVVLTGLALAQSALAQGMRFSIGGSGDFRTYGPDKGIWLEVSSYSANPEQGEIWIRGAGSQQEGSLFVGLRSRQNQDGLEGTIGLGFGMDDRDMDEYIRQSDPLMRLIEMMFLVGIFKVMRTEVNLGLGFPIAEQVGFSLEGYGSVSYIGGLIYGFRSGLSLTLGK